MDKVLILDANQRNALAATRSLGKRGINVVVADETRNTLAGSSKFSRESFPYPSPYKRPDLFIETLSKECRQRDIRVVFPMTEITTRHLLECRGAFSNLRIPFATFEAFELLTDKWRLLELAQKLNITIPATYFVGNNKNLSDLSSKLEFPVVLKPYRSRVWSNGGWIPASVKYANSIAEIKHILGEIGYFNEHPFLIQKYVHGQGRGVFALYDQGRPVVFFSHRRLREKPPTGGVSVMSESIEMDASLRDMAERILSFVKWHGVAMVEFKVSPDGTPYLIEVNARFWGSLQLSIDAGVDFPYLLYQLAIGERPEVVNTYKIGVKSRWLLGDLDHLYLTFKNHSNQDLSPYSKWRAVIKFLKFFEKNTRYEVNRWNDLKPFLFELKQYLRN